MTYSQKIGFVRINTDMKVKVLSERLSMCANDIYYIRHLIKKENEKQVDENLFDTCPITGFKNY